MTMSPSLAELVARYAADYGLAGDGAAELRAEVMRLCAAGALAAAGDKVVAAEILVDSDDPAQVDAASSLALAAMAQDRRGRLLAATAYDRLRRLRGQPQKFGTQVDEDGEVAALWPVDPATTDSERAKWDVPPLAELRQRLR